MADLTARPVESLRRTLRALAAAEALLVVLVLAACSADPNTPEDLGGWHPIELPGAMSPSSMVLIGDTVLIGGSVPVGGTVPAVPSRTPALASLPAAALRSDAVEATTVPLTPVTPYGKQADLVSLTASGDQIVALGAAHGGAHANSRWTIWTGSTRRVIDRPQTFETFGGWDAGTLLGLATDSRGPLVVGTWQGVHGPDGAVWRQSGERWVRQRVSAVLANGVDRQVAPQTVDQQADGSVTISGSVIDLRSGVRQTAAYWRVVDGSWTLTSLPDPGRRSMAWSTVCAASCWSVGDRDGQLAMWSDDGREMLPPTPAGDADSARVLVSGDRTVVVASSNGAGRLFVGRQGRWRSYAAPNGSVRAAQLVGSRLLIITGDQPSAGWVRDIADVLGG